MSQARPRPLRSPVRARPTTVAAPVIVVPALAVLLLASPAFAAPCQTLDARDCSVYDEEARSRCLSSRRAESEVEAWIASAPRDPWPYVAMGEISWGTPASVSWFEAASERFEAVGNTARAIRAQVAIAMAFAQESRCSAMVPPILEAERLAVSSPDPLHALQAGLGRARAHALCGMRLDTQRRALIDIESRLRDPAFDVSRDERYRLRRETLRALSYVARYLGRTREAWDAAIDSAALAREHGCEGDALAFDFDALLARFDQAADLARDHPDLIRQLERMRDRSDTLGVAEFSARTRIMLDYLGQRPDPRSPIGDEALAQLAECRLRARQENIVDIERQCIMAQAAIVASSSPEQARRLLDEATSLVELSPWGSLLSWERHAQAVESLDGPAAADRIVDFVLDRIDALWRGQAETVQERILHRFAPAYYWRSGRMLERYGRSLSRDELARGLAVVERLRANELHDVPAGTWPFDPARNHLGTANVPSTRLLDDLQATLESDEALLSFQLSPEQRADGTLAGGSWLIVVTDDDEDVFTLPESRDLERRIQRFTAGDGGLGPGDDSARGALYDDLLDEALDSLPIGIDRLIIVADAALDRLPWSALAPRAGGDVLGSRFSVEHAPSASFWLHKRGNAPRIAAPSPLVVTVPDDAGDAWFDDRQGLRSLGPLPYSRREARAVYRRLGETGPARPVAADTFLDGGSLPGINLLHFATHAISDEGNVEDAAILIGQNDDGGEVWLDFLTLSRMDLEGKVVVLSTCESHVGEALRGSGVMSLAHAAFLAGAETVLATRAKLPDRDGARFFDQLMSEIARGKSLRSAVFTTRADWIRRHEPPSVWANVVLLGNGDLVLAPGGVSKAWWRRAADAGLHVWDFYRGELLVAIGVILLSVLALRLVRRRRLAR